MSERRDREIEIAAFFGFVSEAFFCVNSRIEKEKILKKEKKDLDMSRESVNFEFYSSPLERGRRDREN